MFNRHSSSLLFLMLIMLSSSYAQNQKRGIRITYNRSGEAYYNYQNSWAVLIGINKFQYMSELEYAVQDAEDIKNLLIEEFNFREDNITLLTDNNANLQNIKSVLGKLRKNTDKNDRVLIFWAGHGYTEKLPEGGKMGYLIPVDGKITDIYSTCLPMNDIKYLSERIPAKHILFLVDACYSGLAAYQTYGFPPETEAYLEKITKARGRQIITAGGDGEEVVENSLWGHSAFTHKLIEGLKNKLADDDNDGLITTTELASYLKPRVTKLSDYRQTPQYRFLSGDGEFVFITEAEGDFVGMIHIRTEPWCNVFLDGEKVCTSPYIIKYVSPGSHRLVLKRQGYWDIVKEINISENNHLIRISENLIEK